MASELNKDLKAFVARNTNIITANLEDLKVSRGFKSGFGFSDSDRELRGKEGRAEVTVNLVKPWSNAVVASYTSAPFGLSAKRYDGAEAGNVGYAMDHSCKKADITDLAARALDTIVSDGYAYVPVSPEIDNPMDGTQYPKPELLDNGRLFMDDCDDPTGADCQMAVYCEPIRKETAQERYKLNPRTMRTDRDPMSEIKEFSKDTQLWTTVITVYQKVGDGVEVRTMVHGQEVGKAKKYPGLPRLPIVRIPGDKVWLQSKEAWVYRGAYFQVYDLLRTLNYTMSLQAERIATNPTVKYLAAKGVFKGSSADLADINKKPKLYVEYEPFDSNGRPLPPPTPFPVDKDNTDLVGISGTISEMINGILGSTLNDAPENETREGVLLRKSSKEATVNRYIKGLQEGLEAVGEVMLSFLPLLYPAQIPSVSDYYVVTDKGPIAESVRQRSAAQLLALNDVVKENPANPLLPAIIASLDMPEETKQQVAMALQPKDPGTDPQQIQMAMQQKDAQIQQLQQALQESQKAVSQLQINLNEFVDDSEIKLRIAQMDNETKIFLKRLELAQSNEELQAKLQADFMAQQQKLQADLTRKRLELQAKAPPVPVFGVQRNFV